MTQRRVRAAVGIVLALAGSGLLAQVFLLALAGDYRWWNGLVGVLAMLYLRPGTREHFLAHLARDWPELLPRYERLYRGRAYLGKAEVEPVRREVAELRHRFAVVERPHLPPPPAPSASHAEPVQLSLEALVPTPLPSGERRNRERRNREAGAIVSAA